MPRPLALDQAILQVRAYYQRTLRNYGDSVIAWGDFDGDTLTFTLNAVNGYGGFTGPRRMVAIFENGRLSRISG